MTDDAMFPHGDPEYLRLDHLPIIGHAMRKLGVRKLVNDLVQDDVRCGVSTGECIEAMLVSILKGGHTLYDLAGRLLPYDLEVAFGWESEALSFNDQRLAKALDDLFKAGPAELYAACLDSSLRNYELDLSTLHFDTTSVKVYGDYALSSEPEDPDEVGAVPHMTPGFSKDHRPDLKQFQLSLTVTGDGAVPVFGRAASGNRSDSEEARSTLGELVKLLPDPSDVTVIGDSKFFAGETLLRVARHGVDYITLVPRSVGVWDEAFRLFMAERESKKGLPPLKVRLKKGRGEAGTEPERTELEKELDSWKGLSFDLTYDYKHVVAEEKVVTPIPARLLVVESEPLKKRKRKSLRKKLERERLSLTKKFSKLAKENFKCCADAQRRAKKIRALSPTFHTLQVEVREDEVRVKRSKPGRPPKGEKPEVEQVWRVVVQVEEEEGAFEWELLRASVFVLSTSRSRTGPRALSDVEFLADYDSQHLVERCMHWVKGPLRVAPIFLKTPRRIAALSVVYVLALMVYALIQREVRQCLAAAKTTMPSNKGWNDHPTTEVLFRLFWNVGTLRGASPNGTVLVMGMNTEQVRILNLLGHSLPTQEGVRIHKPRKPRPGERAWKPVPRSAEDKERRRLSRLRKKASASKKPKRHKPALWE